jgi:restriction system protein
MIPQYEEYMLPLLNFAADGQEHTNSETYDRMAREFNVSDDERAQRFKSGAKIFPSRVHWAILYLSRAGLLEATRRACFKITSEGLRVVAQKPDYIDVQFLRAYPEFVKFLNKKAGQRKTKPQESHIVSEKTPDEQLDSAYNELRQNLAEDLLATVKVASPQFFENLVVDVLVKMGYGGSTEDAGEAVGKTGDGGIDGVIKQDPLGLGVLYVQAKRWEGSVGSPEIQKFVGALHGKHTRQGVFITTGSFTAEATRYVKNIDDKIILIDGERLAELMIDHNVGVSTITEFEVKKVDLDYFAED